MKNNNFQIPSEWLNCKSNTKDLFVFLSSIQNLEKILPKDKINNIQILDNKLSFQIENIITLNLFINKTELTDKLSYIEYQSEPFGNYHLSLTVNFQNNQSQIILTGYLNPFVLSIAQKKLTHLIQRINQELAAFIITEHQ